MTIELLCSGCGQKIRVPDEHAGKHARCPQCQTVTQVSATAATSTAAEPTSTGEETWYMKTPDGNSYGPVDRLELERWISEGRLIAACHLRDGEEGAWLPSAQVFPALDADRTSPQAGNPFGNQDQQQAGNIITPRPTPHYQVPHRGTLILVLGILSWIICPFIGIAAWIMGRADMEAMRAKRMDPEGMGLTQVGMILGIVQCVLTVLSGIVLIIAIVFLVILGLQV